MRGFDRGLCKKKHELVFTIYFYIFFKGQLTLSKNITVLNFISKARINDFLKQLIKIKKLSLQLFKNFP